jgi:hypothetical protein
MPDLDLGGDEQDSAEAYDETNREDELQAADGDDWEGPDVAPDVYDVTSAVGDADDEDYELDASDFSDDVDGDDIEEDEDDDASLRDGFENEPDDLGLSDDDDDAVDVIAGRSAPSEPGLAYVADVDASTDPRDDEAEKYESTRPLSDEQLEDLGYRDAQDKTTRPSEKRAFGDDRETAIEGSGATADDVADESDAGDEDRLDEGLEETFPASDPVSAKHIT